MTRLKKSVSRVTADKVMEAGKVRQIIVTLEAPNLLYFRAKGCRKRYVLTAVVCYLMAVKAELRQKEREKKQTKKIRKGQK